MEEKIGPQIGFIAAGGGRDFDREAARWQYAGFLLVAHPRGFQIHLRPKEEKA